MVMIFPDPSRARTGEDGPIRICCFPYQSLYEDETSLIQPFLPMPARSARHDAATTTRVASRHFANTLITAYVCVVYVWWYRIQRTGFFGLIVQGAFS